MKFQIGRLILRNGSRLFRGILILLAMLPGVSASASELPTAWILVDTESLTLTVRSDRNRLIARFDNISIGSGGTAAVRRAGQEKTPLGTFHVAWINRNSPYRIFFGLNYPTARHAEEAFLQGIIDRHDFDAIIGASRNRSLPPQNTPLGGFIGIHGVGAGDPAIHHSINWTDGCIALSNAEAIKLARWIRIGTRVVIQ